MYNVGIRINHGGDARGAAAKYYSPRAKILMNDARAGRGCCQRRGCGCENIAANGAGIYLMYIKWLIIICPFEGLITNIM